MYATLLCLGLTTFGARAADTVTSTKKDGAVLQQTTTPGGVSFADSDLLTVDTRDNQTLVVKINEHPWMNSAIVHCTMDKTPGKEMITITKIDCGEGILTKSFVVTTSATIDMQLMKQDGSTTKCEFPVGHIRLAMLEGQKYSTQYIVMAKVTTPQTPATTDKPIQASATSTIGDQGKSGS